MRISDWSSDVCSSDLPDQAADWPDHRRFRDRHRRAVVRDRMGGVEAGVAAGTGTALVLYRALAGLSAMVDLSVVVSFRRLCAAYLLVRRRDGGRQRVDRKRVV